MRAIFNQAYLDGNIDQNPMVGIKNLKSIPKEPNPFVQKEISLIHSSKTNLLGEKNAVLLNVFTGNRIGELLALAWEDIDFDKQELRVRRSVILGEYKMPKTSGSIRTVELDDIAIRILRHQYKITAHLKPATISILNSDYSSYHTEKLRFIFVNSKTR